MKPATLAPVLLAAALLASCGDPPPAEADPTPSVPDAPKNRIAISPTVRGNLGITFVEVEVRRVAQTLRVPGAFELQPSARREYRMALPGRVELLVDQYERVAEGTPLFRFESPAWPELLHEIVEAEQALDTAGAEIEVARAKLEEARGALGRVRERLAALAQADFKRADLDAEAAQLAGSLPRLEAELRLAETRRENARRARRHALHRAAAASDLTEADLEAEVVVDGERVPAWDTIERIEVRAARAGVVEALEVTDGAFVEPPTTVLTTVDTDRVRFRALALQADLPRLSGASEARIVPPRSDGLPLANAVEATLAIGLEAHPEERTLTLLATPAELAPWIRPGVSAFLEVVVDASDGPALAIPRSAIVRDGLQHVFFRRNPADPNQAIRVEADLGVDDGRWVVIESGLMRGDEVVLDGAYELKLAMAQSGFDPTGGHFHADGSFHDEH